MIGPVKSPSVHLKTTLVMCGQLKFSVNMYLSTTTTFCFVNFSVHENSTKLVLYSKFTYESQFSEKSSLEICLLVLEILNKQTFFPFFETPVYNQILTTIPRAHPQPTHPGLGCG